MTGRVNPQHTDDFQEVRRQEAVEIEIRRRAAGVPHSADDKEMPRQLVGLALSGGGIRAASVGLGALESLFKNNRFQQVDYLSTVSGGGYIGGYLSTAAISHSASVEQALGMSEPHPTDNDAGAGLPHLVQRIIYGGKYLFRPWEAINKYLIGLFLRNLLLISGLVATAAGIAYLWRMLDFNGVRNFLELFNFNNGVVTALLPFIVLFACWLAAWLVSMFQKKGEAPGTAAQRLLYFTFGALLIGLAMLATNAETPVGFLSVFLGEKKVAESSTLLKCLLGLLGAGLTPFVAPKILLQFGLRPKNFWQRTVFHAAMFALLVGIPLLFVGMLGMPNISGILNDSGYNLRAGDILSWPAFLGLMDQSQSRLTAEKARAFEQFVDESGDEKLTPEEKIERKRQRAMLAIPIMQDQTRKVMEAMEARSKVRDDLEDYPSRLDRLVLLADWLIVRDKNNLLSRYWQADRQVHAEQIEFCRLFNTYELTSTSFPQKVLTNSILQIQPAPLPEEDVRPKPVYLPHEKLFTQIESKLREKKANILKGDSLISADKIEDAKLSYGKNWSTRQIKSFNLDLLSAMQPECFYEPGKAYRHLVIEGDQSRRAWIGFWALCVFVPASLLVNLNGTSLHRFYRNRLRFAYLIPFLQNRFDFPLAGLDTTAKGAPYHLINATVDIKKPRFLDQVDAEAEDQFADRRNVQTFMFSKLFCGSDCTGWASTEHYEGFRNDNIDVADAIALSGSAMDPMRVGGLALATAMSALNVNLGQWMPNPRFEAPKFKPSFFSWYRDWLRPRVADSTYCYVSDGGFTDNLGIMSLLRRRCRLIIAVDASCDAVRSFSDLNWVIRAARVRYGVKILEPHQDADSEEVLSTSCLEPDQDGRCQRHFLLAKIKYPGAKESSWLVYLKPSFTGDEGSDLLRYQLEAKEFPNDSTTNQFYEPQQVEAYRQLGFHIVNDFCKQVDNTHANDLFAAVAKLAQAQVNEKQVRKQQFRQLNILPEVAADSLVTGQTIANYLAKLLAQRKNENPRIQNGNHVPATPVANGNPHGDKPALSRQELEQCVSALAAIEQMIAELDDALSQSAGGSSKSAPKDKSRIQKLRTSLAEFHETLAALNSTLNQPKPNPAPHDPADG